MRTTSCSFTPRQAATRALATPAACPRWAYARYAPAIAGLGAGRGGGGPTGALRPDPSGPTESGAPGDRRPVIALCGDWPWDAAAEVGHGLPTPEHQEVPVTPQGAAPRACHRRRLAPGRLRHRWIFSALRVPLCLLAHADPPLRRAAPPRRIATHTQYRLLRQNAWLSDVYGSRRVASGRPYPIRTSLAHTRHCCI